MKKLFEIPQLKVVRFEEADIILSSGCGCEWVDVYCTTYDYDDNNTCWSRYYFHCDTYVGGYTEYCGGCSSVTSSGYN